MSKFERIDGPISAGGDWAVMQDVWAWRPIDKYAKDEAVGAVSWTGGALTPIKADASLPQSDLPERLKNMISHCWKKGIAPTTAPRGPIVMGGNRQPSVPPLPSARPQYVPMVNPTSSPLNPATAAAVGADPRYLEGVATDWKIYDYLNNRINAYTFRGDSRPPAALRTAKGFFPPITRNDRSYVEGAMYTQFSEYMERRFKVTVTKQTFLDAYDKVLTTPAAKDLMHDFTSWRTLCEAESLHLGRMLANEALKGYISTTKATVVAKGFAKSGGWVYVTLIKGGFVVPEQKKHAWTSIFGEQEIAYPGGVPWSDIMGFRQVAPTGPYKFIGPIFFRKGFEGKDTRNAFEACYELLSGKTQ